MTTVPQSNGTVQFDTALRTPKPQAYYGHLYDEPGILAKVSGKLYFVTEADHQILDFEPDMVAFCTVLGACSIADTQAIQDRLRGGAAAIACRRPMGRTEEGAP